MRPNKLRQLLNEGRPSICHHVATTSPDVVEIIGRAGGVDYVEFVAEYMPYDLHSLDNFGRALELTGMSGMIKVDQENKAYTAGRALGSGLQNILFSDTRTAEEARGVRRGRPRRDAPDPRPPRRCRPAFRRVRPRDGRPRTTCRPSRTASSR